MLLQQLVLTALGVVVMVYGVLFYFLTEGDFFLLVTGFFVTAIAGMSAYKLWRLRNQLPDNIS